MPDRFWVGGAGNWSSTAKWSATSGGASGASVPTTADVAIFDANSGGKFIATVDTAQSVGSITITPSATIGVLQIALSARLTTNNLTTTSTAGNNRVWFRGNTTGIAEDLVVNGTVSISDCDFRDIYVTGTSAPISGTRIGNLSGCRGITFSTPKTVYWVGPSSANWSSNSWAATSGGAAATSNFPLGQDTAVINNVQPSAGQTITIDAALPNTGTVDASARTNFMNINPGTCFVHGDWKNGTGAGLSGGSTTITFSGRNTQTITSAGKVFLGNITIDSYGGTVQLADALSLATNATPITVTNGTFDTAGYSVTAGSLVSSNSNVRSIFLQASTVTLSGATPLTITTSTNLTFNAGTSTINLSSSGSTTVNTPGITYNNVAFTNTSTAVTLTIAGSGNVFNNLTVAAPALTGTKTLVMGSATAYTINGTLTISGGSPIRRMFLRSSTVNSTTSLVVNAISATDCDFRDVIITGAAAGSSPTRAGDCGGNTGINFPASKTVYWNLSGTQNWSADGWAATSGGSTSSTNFPLAQDTAVFNNAGAAGTVTIDQTWQIGSIDMSSRTTAMTLANNSLSVAHGNWAFGTGVTSSSTAAPISFEGRGNTQTITSNGVVFGHPITVNKTGGTAQLADALTLDAARTLSLTGTGTFDAVTYNVTVGLFSTSGSGILLMGSGTWTLSGTGTVWSIAGISVLDPQTANIVLSNTSTTARTFSGGNHAYNKLTIGGATGTSTLTLSGGTYSELASTKTVAHTIALGTGGLVVGKWSVTGTAGNVVTLTGTSTTSIIAGPATSGIDYLAMGSIGFSATSPGEFYAGANSTGTAVAPVFRTAPPAPRTLYWVGGTGNWSNTARWDTTSGGPGGAAVPTSLDAVIFNAASNATAYTATIDVDSRCSTLTIAGPASGNVTLAGTAALLIQNSLTLPATGLTRTFTGAITLSGTGSGKVVTTNGVTLASAITVYGIGASWALGSALNMGTSVLTVNAGAFSLSTYNLTAATIVSNFAPARTIDFGSGTTTLSSDVTFGSTASQAQRLTVIPGTSQINLTSVNPNFQGNSKTFNNVTYTGINFGTSLAGGNTFNNLTFNARTSTGVTTITFGGTTTVTGTLSKPAGADATRRHVFGTSAGGATLACNAVSFTDVDFINITLTGAAAPASGTRLGDRKGNTGITFDAPKTVYWNLAGSQNWSAVGWATTIGGTPAANNLPLAQDTAVFTATSPASGSTSTFDQTYAVGTIDMSARTTNTLTLSIVNSPFITGNWINGTGTTISGSQVITFGGRTSQTITSAGNIFTQAILIDSPGGSVTLQDAMVLSVASPALVLTNGAFDANNYNVTLSAATGGAVSTSGVGVRTLAVGAGTWTLAGSGTPWNVGNRTNLTITGTGTITLTSASGKNFNGGAAEYTNITLNQGGAGVLTILNNNAFKDITNTYKSTGATSINFGNFTQRVSQWTAAGEVGRLLTIQGTSESSPGTLILTGVVDPAADYLIIQNIRAYAITDTWYAGNNSQNEGSLGWIFETGATIYAVFVSEASTAADAVAATVVYPVSLVDSAQALDQLAALFVAQTEVSETAQAADAASTSAALAGTVSETAQALDTVSTTASVIGAVSETSIVSDAAASDASVSRAVAESATAQDTQVVAASTFTAALVDTTTGADSTSAVAALGAAVADTAAALDVTTSASFVNRSVTDTATGADTAAGALIVTVAYADSAAVQDVQAVAASAFSGIAAETARAADTTVARAGFVASVADTVVARDTTSTRAIQPVSVAESITASDTDTATVIFRSALAETAVAQDTTSTSASLIVQFTDSAAASEIISSTPEYGALVEDAATGSDDAQAAATVVSFVAEQAEADAVTAVAGSVFSVDAFEQAVGQDLTTAGGEFFVSLAEFATISDQNLSKFLWNPIPDVQVPDWQIINDTQAANWQIIDDEQPAVWTPIST